MNSIVVLLDINGQKSININTLINYLKNLDAHKVVFTGAFGLMANWRTKFAEALGDDSKVLPIQPSSYQSGALIDLTIWATHNLKMDENLKNCQWLVISKTRGMKALCEYLEEQGVNRATWCPAPTPDFLSAQFLNEKEVGNTIRLVASQMLTKNRNQPILVGQVANEIIAMLPEMRDKEYREKIFGTQKFQRICANLGMKTKNKHILSI